MKGRKKIPDELKALRGTDQPCRMEKTATTTSALTTLPKTGLKGTAKKVFILVATELMNKGLLDIICLDLVVAYCREMALYHDTMRDLETEGYTIEVETKNGTMTIINPKRKIAESALSAAKSLASEFGLTPASRNRVSVMLTDTKPKDDFIDFEEIQ